MNALRICPGSTAPAAEVRGSLRRIAAAAAGLEPPDRERRDGGRRRIAAIQRETNRIERLLDDRRDAARIERGALELQTESVGPATLVLEAVTGLRSGFAARRLSVTVCVQEEMPAVHVDRRRMLRVVTTLIDNAIRRSSRGGAIHIEAAARGASILFSVTGPARAEPGLEAARGIVEAHGGRIGRGRSRRMGRVTRVVLPVVPAIP
jgi:signal transduction histidine kinase